MSRPRPKDPRSPGKVTDDPCGTLKNENTWKDEDDVSHVKRDGCDRGLAEAGQESTSRRTLAGQAEVDGLDGLGLKTTVQAYFLIWR